MRRVSIRCPECGETISVELSDDALRRASTSPSGLAAVVVVHRGHALIVYVDGEGKVRAASVTSVHDARILADVVPVPNPKHPDLRRLSKEELRLFAFCDGKTPLRVIARSANIPYGRARILAEKLKNLGYLKELKMVMEG